MGFFCSRLDRDSDGLTESTRDSVRVVMFLLLLFDDCDEGEYIFLCLFDVESPFGFACVSAAESHHYRNLGDGGGSVI